MNSHVQKIFIQSVERPLFACPAQREVKGSIQLRRITRTLKESLLCAFLVVITSVGKIQEVFSMKKRLSLAVIVLLLSVCLLSACGGVNDPETTAGTTAETTAETTTETTTEMTSIETTPTGIVDPKVIPYSTVFIDGTLYIVPSEPDPEKGEVIEITYIEIITGETYEFVGFTVPGDNLTYPDEQLESTQLKRERIYSDGEYYYVYIDLSFKIFRLSPAPEDWIPGEEREIWHRLSFY